MEATLKDFYRPGTMWWAVNSENGGLILPRGNRMQATCKIHPEHRNEQSYRKIPRVELKEDQIYRSYGCIHRISITPTEWYGGRVRVLRKRTVKV